jgi:hypothetical protein
MEGTKLRLPDVTAPRENTTREAGRKRGKGYVSIEVELTIIHVDATDSIPISNGRVIHTLFH